VEPLIKIRSKPYKKPDFSNRILFILEDGNSLPQIQIARLLNQITDDDIALLAKGQPASIRGHCELERYFVGQGTCLAKKYGKYGVAKDTRCETCRSQEIVDQLNYIFEHRFAGKYHAEWRNKRKIKR
jgi:hypothetical protein